ncbi:MAG: hypothetical protein R6V04_07850 [bacterium]
MNIILRKIKNTPVRLRIIHRELSFVIDGFWKSLGEAYLISRRLRNSKIQSKRINAVAVINSARSYPVSDIELYFAHLLFLNGLTVYVLYDDGVLEHWDSSQSNKFKYYSPFRAKWNIRIRHKIRKKLVGLAYKNRRIHYINYSRIIDKVQPDTTVDQSDRAYALSSTKRFFQTGIIDTNVKEHNLYYKKSLQNCAVSRTVAQFTLKYLKPDLYITSHGIYSVWGPAYRKMKEAEVPTVVWQVPGTTSRRIRLIDRQDQILASTTDWKVFDYNTIFSEQMLQTGKALFEARINHDAYDTQEYFSDRVDGEDTVKKITVNHRGFTLAMFPNVVWDGDIPERNILFENVIDWCEFTINTIKNSNNHLYIRFHPSEVTRLKGTVKMEDILRQRLPDIDTFSNITLIFSDEQLDTYTFARSEIDLGLIFDGTLCLELTYMGIPVIACTNGNFTLDEVVFKPDNRKKYSEWLINPSVILKKFKKEKDKRFKKAIKYAFWLYNASLYEFIPLEKPYPAKLNYKDADRRGKISSDQSRITERLLRPLTGSYT